MLEDRRLIRRCKRGSREALGRIYDKYSPGLYTAAVLLLNDRAAAEDAVQDTFVTFAQSIDRIRGDGSLKAFLYTCVTNRARDLLRRRKIEPSGDLSCDPPARDAGPPLETVRKETAERVAAAMACLPEEQRQAVVLRVHGEMTYRGIARCQAVSPDTARSRVRFGIGKLRTLLNGECP